MILTTPAPVGAQPNAEGTCYQGIASKELARLKADNELLQQGMRDANTARARTVADLAEARGTIVDLVARAEAAEAKTAELTVVNQGLHISTGVAWGIVKQVRDLLIDLNRCEETTETTTENNKSVVVVVLRMSSLIRRNLRLATKQIKEAA